MMETVKYPVIMIYYKIHENHMHFNIFSHF